MPPPFLMLNSAFLIPPPPLWLTAQSSKLTAVSQLSEDAQIDPTKLEHLERLPDRTLRLPFLSDPLGHLPPKMLNIIPDVPGYPDLIAQPSRRPVAALPGRLDAATSQAAPASSPNR